MNASNESRPLHRRRRRRLSLVARGALAVLLASPIAAQGADYALNGGPSETGHQHWTTALFAERIGAPLRWQGLGVSGDFGLGFVRARGTPADRLNHSVWIGFGGVRASLPDTGVWRHVFLGFGVGLTHGKTNALSSTGEFVDTLGWQDGHWDAMIRHISNGHLSTGPNVGETMLLVGVRF